MLGLHSDLDDVERIQNGRRRCSRECCRNASFQISEGLLIEIPEICQPFLEDPINGLIVFQFLRDATTISNADEDASIF